MHSTATEANDKVAATPPPGRVDAAGLKALLAGKDELALLDVRETGAFSARQIFYAVSMPLSHLEERVAALVPRLATPIVLVDAGASDGGLAQRAAALMQAWGYTNVKLLDGGLQGWADAGYQFFSGVYVPNKAFGEYIEHHYDTPYIDAATLKEWRDSGKDILILDSRPYDEFKQFSLPDGINCPGGELAYRAFGMVPDEKTTIVINCAGRTRGIIGAQTLINAGIRNPVVTLKNGTAGWHLDGSTLREGASDVAPPPTHDGLQRALQAAQEVAQRFGVQEINAGELRKLQSDQDRSLFVLDVRSPEEYLAGHLPGAISAPGGQLIQSTEHYVGVHRARIVLVDDNGVRARFAASWLVQLGWTEVVVLANGLHAAPFLQRGAAPTQVLGDIPDMPLVSVADAHAAWKAGEALLYDFGSSLDYRRGHIPGAWFAVRSRIRASLAGLADGKRLIVTSPDGRFAAYAARDLQALTSGCVQVLQGGTQAWRAAGLPLTTGLEQMADDNDDVWYSPYDFADRSAAMESYLTWEVGLVAQLEHEQVAFLPPDDRAVHRA